MFSNNSYCIRSYNFYFYRKNGFVYQYLYPTLYSQDLEGKLTIHAYDNIFEVVGGLCQDFFEFREVANYINLVTVM